MGTKVCTMPYSQGSSNQRYIRPRPILWLQYAATRVRTGFRWASGVPASLPQHNSSSPSTTCPAPSGTQIPGSGLRLMTCMNYKRSRKRLQQGCVASVKTNQDLFYFLRNQYASRCKRLLLALSFKSVQGIYLVKFDLTKGGDVIVRDHEPYCTVTTAAPKDCECLPPASKVEPSPGAEYRCLRGPPATIPSIPPEFLLERFLRPSIEGDDDY
jgi:hypothetical protein